MNNSELANLAEGDGIDVDVAVIGAGPGGLTIAYALLQQGLTVKVFEKAKQLQAIGGALGLFPNAYKALAAIDSDLCRRVLAIGVEPQTQVIQTPTGKILFQGLSPFATLQAKYGQPFQWMSWFRLQRVLCQALPAEMIALNHRCSGFSQKSGSVIVHFAEQPSVQARLVIGADGINSLTRQIILNDGKPIYRNAMSWRGLIEEGDDLSYANYARKFYFLAGEGKNFVIVDVGEGMICWTATVFSDSEQVANSPEESKLRVLQEFSGWDESVGIIVEKTEASSIVERGIYDRLPVPKWSQGRITLLGDAAHSMRPTLGQGTAMAFEDAYVLSVCLSKTDDWELALSQYESQRISRTQIIQEQALIAGEKAYQEDRAKNLAQASKNWRADDFDDWLYNFPEIRE